MHALRQRLLEAQWMRNREHNSLDGEDNNNNGVLEVQQSALGWH